jgi:hypothetical protein
MTCVGSAGSPPRTSPAVLTVIAIEPLAAFGPAAIFGVGAVYGLLSSAVVLTLRSVRSVTWADSEQDEPRA